MGDTMRILAGLAVIGFLPLHAGAECPAPPPYVGDPYGPRCGLYYSYESYSLGLANGFEGLGVMPVPMDETCYELGLRAGEDLAAAFAQGRSACDAAYADAKHQALAGEPHSITLPSECSNTGYPVGETLAPIMARLDGDTGGACLRAYSSGRVHGYCAEEAGPPSSGGLASCYVKGYEDGVALRP